MRNDRVESKCANGQRTEELPRPTTQFRWRAWLAFQRALDPLAPPKPLPLKRR
jgi:hypothetical protein